MIHINVLDIGCGLNPKKDANYRLDYVKTPVTTHVVNIDNERLPFDDGFFDKIYCFHVLEHLNNVEHAMREINRCAKKGAEIIIEVPYFRSPISVNALHKTYWSYDSFDYWTEDNGRMILEGNPRFMKKDINFIFDEATNAFCKKMCEFVIKRNPYLYQNIFAVFFPARSIQIVMSK